MTAAFADTFYWVSLANPDDLAHREAVAFDRARGRRTIVTTEEVLAEFLAYFADRGTYLRQKAVLITRRILDDPTVRVRQQSHATFSDGFELYSARLDKGYSLTDCVSMQTMRQAGLNEALTSDHHFEQEGFRALFRRGR